MNNPLHADFYADNAVQQTVRILENVQLARDTYRDVFGALVKLSVSESLESGVPGVGASAVKLFYSELNQRVCELAMRVLGRASLAREDVGDLPSGRVLSKALQSLSLTIAAGSSQIQRNIIGERILGLPREPRRG